MNSAVLLIALSVQGVDVGWQEAEDGSIEYIIQIEPQLVESLKDGHDLTSGVRPELRHIRRYRVVVGSEKLPQNPPLEELKRRWEEEKAAAKAAEPAPKPIDEPKGEPVAEPKKSDVPPAFQDLPPIEFPERPKEPLGSNPFGEAEKPGPLDKKDEPTPVEPASEEPTEKPSLEDSASNPPSTFQPDDTEKPLVKHVAGYAEADPTGDTQEVVVEQDPGVATERPWGTLIVVLLALFASLGLNAFLGWITVEQRGKYRSLLAKDAGAGI